MQNKTIGLHKTQFAEDIYKGLKGFPKRLSSKYFYDQAGDKLFQEIMNMPEYYLTDAEFNILTERKEEIINWFGFGDQKLNLVELGAGDGKKTKILLEQMSANGHSFKYVPIDISQNALDSLEASIAKELPTVEIETRQGSYFEVLKHLGTLNHSKKVILFLGSNIGNLLHSDAVEFLKKLQEVMTDDDLLLVGFDQKKNPQTVLDAYNDADGITEAFNKNILYRINREFGGNFEPDNFLHWEVYDPESGTAKSYLVSKKEQHVRIEDLGMDVVFRPWETIHTEISQKYDDEVVNWLAEKASLSIAAVFGDKEGSYKDYLFKKQ